MDKECTFFIEGNWHYCCVRHDYDYADAVPKFKADKDLAGCIWRSGLLGKAVAPFVFTAVTIFGWIPYKRYKKDRPSTPT